MYWMVVLYNYENHDYALLKHNLSYDEAVMLCDDYRVDGFPAFIVQQTEGFHESSPIADDCTECLRELQSVLQKHGIIL